MKNSLLKDRQSHSDAPAKQFWQKNTSFVALLLGTGISLSGASAERFSIIHKIIKADAPYDIKLTYPLPTTH